MSTTKIVRIGGGSSAHVLRGLMRLRDTEITAIVPMTDSGRSSGMLRDRWGVLPPGDALKALIALSGLPDEEWDVINRFLRFRIEGNGLHDHAVGNFLLAGMESYTSSFEQALRAAEQALRVKGRVVPVTVTNTHVCAELVDGTIVEGETHIDIPKEGRPLLPITRLWLKPEARATEDALRAISEADIVVIGPGDLYSSIGCCLVVEGIAEALRATKATIVLVLNLTTKRGETGGFEGRHPDFTASDYIRVVEGWMGRTIDWPLFNSEPFPDDVIANYAAEGAVPVAPGECMPVPDLHGRRAFFARFAEIVTDDGTQRRFVRHHPRETAKVIGIIVGAQMEPRAGKAVA